MDMKNDYQDLSPDDEIKKDLQTWGVGLLIVGVVSFIFSGFLDPIWGGMLVVLGIITLLIPRAGMYIVIGIIIIIAGLLNMLGGGGWLVFGIVQIVIGIQLLVKYGKVSS